MNSFLRKLLSLLLIIVFICQTNAITAEANGGFIEIKEGFLKQTFIEEQFIEEQFIEPQYIYEHVIYEDQIYEYIIPERFLCETQLYEITITPDTITNLVEILPPQFNDYNIDWPGVITKFTIGTTIIIAVGVISVLTDGTSDFFIMASPLTVAKDAFIGAAIGTALNITINEIKANGKLPDRALYKYAIEGFADGYMWGAITSILKVAIQNTKRLIAFKKATGGILKIKLNGDVLDTSGKYIGKAYYDASKVWHLIDEVGNKTTFFDSAGNELMSTVGTVLPANETLRLGSGTASKICYTDATGLVYRIDDTLKPNLTYKLGDCIYHTDNKGRKILVEFDHLTMKAEGRGRLPIADSLKIIGKGNERLNDQRGHLIADRFNGDNTLANLVPQSPTANQTRFAEIESILAEAIENGQNVSGSIQINYKGNSFRPTSFIYSYNTGDIQAEVFIPNK